MVHLQDAVVVVTGASSGIGRATALALAARGCRLLLCGRDRERLEELARRTEGECFVADLGDAAETVALGESLAERAPDVVVHNAGIGLCTPAERTEDDTAGRLFTVNALAPMRLDRALLPAMRRRGSGRLVFVGSIAGVLGAPMESAYAATKAALGGYAESLRHELVADGIGVTTVTPGVVETEFFSRRGTPYQRRFPRPVRAARVAQAIARGLERDSADIVVPGWLRVPIVLRAVAPRLYSGMSARWS